MEVSAKAKFIRMSPRKVRLVADVIRGLDVEEALVQLEFNKRAASLPLVKLLKSAISNAEQNHQLKRDNLFVKELTIDDGPTLKRWRPRAFGRATMLRKRSSHIAIVLGERVPTVLITKANQPAKKQADIIKVNDLEELKDLDREEKSEDHLTGDGRQKVKRQQQKGFTNKIFNRRSGQK